MSEFQGNSRTWIMIIRILLLIVAFGITIGRYISPTPPKSPLDDMVKIQPDRYSVKADYNQGWTNDQEAILYVKAHHIADNLFSSASSKDQMSGCVVTKMKNEYPAGINAVPAEQVKTSYLNAVKACAIKARGTSSGAWSPQLEQQIKTAILHNTQIKTLPVKDRNKYCNCYIRGLKAAYPKGIKNKLSKNVMDKLTISCMAKLFSK